MTAVTIASVFNGLGEFTEKPVKNYGYEGVPTIPIMV